jgi:hypothetical protein
MKHKAYLSIRLAIQRFQRKEERRVKSERECFSRTAISGGSIVARRWFFRKTIQQ